MNDAPYHDISGHLPARSSVYMRARKVREEAQRAMELALDGPRCDVPLALEHLDAAKAILGGGE